MAQVQPADYWDRVTRSLVLCQLQSLLLQEAVKVFVITLISPQLLPPVNVLAQDAKAREAARYASRAVFSTFHALLVAVS